MSKLFLILGNQLFSPELLEKQFIGGTTFQVFMREDFELCTYYQFHQQKIAFFLTAMRDFRDELERQNIKVHYETMCPDSRSYEDALLDYIEKNSIAEVTHFEIEDKFFESRIQSALKRAQVRVKTITSPLFLTSRLDFKTI